MANETLRVKGYKELLRACARAEKDSRKEVRAAFRRVGEIVRADAQSKFAGVDARSAAGYKVRVRQRGIAVEQSLRKTTGLRPQFGALQMRRALLPSMAENEDATEREFEKAMDHVAETFARGA